MKIAFLLSCFVLSPWALASEPASAPADEPYQCTARIAKGDDSSPKWSSGKTTLVVKSITKQTGSLLPLPRAAYGAVAIELEGWTFTFSTMRTHSRDTGYLSAELKPANHPFGHSAACTGHFASNAIACDGAVPSSTGNVRYVMTCERKAK